MSLQFDGVYEAGAVHGLIYSLTNSRNMIDPTGQSSSWTVETFYKIPSASANASDYNGTVPTVKRQARLFAFDKHTSQFSYSCDKNSSSGGNDIDLMGNTRLTTGTIFNPWNSSTPNTANPIGATADDTWHHIAISWDKTNVYLAFDGQIVTTTLLYGSTNNMYIAASSILQGFAIGGEPVDDGNSSIPFGGLITNFRIVVGSALYKTTYTVPTTSLSPISGTTLLLQPNGAYNAMVDNGPNAYSPISTRGTSFNGMGPFPPVPLAPQNFAASYGNGTVSLTWAAPTNAATLPPTGYNLVCSDSSKNNASISSTATSATISGLTNGTAYTFTLNAYTATLTGLTASVSATPRTTPGAPTPVEATINASGQARITWTAPTSDGMGGNGSLSYAIVTTNVSTGTTSTVTLVTSPYIFTSGLTSGTSYTFQVKASNDICVTYGTASTATSAVIPYALLTAPTNLSVVTPSNPSIADTLHVTWKSPADGYLVVDYYIITFTNTTTNTTSTTTVNRDATDTGSTGGFEYLKKPISNLIDGNSYTVTVAAHSTSPVTTTGPAFSPAATMNTPYDKVSAPTVSGTGVTITGPPITMGVDLSWTSVSSNGNPSVTYDVIQYDDAAGTNPVTTSAVTTSTSAGVAKTYRITTNINANTTYYFAVKAYGSSDTTSATSSIISVTPVATPNAVTAVVATNSVSIATGSPVMTVSVSWTAPAAGSPPSGYAVAMTVSSVNSTGGKTFVETLTRLNAGTSTSYSYVITNSINSYIYSPVVYAYGGTFASAVFSTSATSDAADISAGISYWLDAKDLASITTTANRSAAGGAPIVTSILDKSGNNATVTAAGTSTGGGSGPVYLSSATSTVLGNLTSYSTSLSGGSSWAVSKGFSNPAILFNKANTEKLTATSLTGLNAPGSIFAVYMNFTDSSNNTAGAGMSFGRPSDGATIGDLFGYYDPMMIRSTGFYKGNNHNTRKTKDYGFVIKSAYSSAAGSSFLRLNGTTYNQTGGTNFDGSTLPGFDGLVMGNYGFNNDYPSDMLLCEVILYKRYLSTAEAQAVEGYLANRWGLGSSLPANHPYYSSPYTGIIQTTPSYYSVNLASVSAADAVNAHVNLSSTVYYNSYITQTANPISSAVELRTAIKSIANGAKVGLAKAAAISALRSAAANKDSGASNGFTKITSRQAAYISAFDNTSTVNPPNTAYPIYDIYPEYTGSNPATATVNLNHTVDGQSYASLIASKTNYVVFNIPTAANANQYRCTLTHTDNGTTSSVTLWYNGTNLYDVNDATKTYTKNSTLSVGTLKIPLIGLGSVGGGGGSSDATLASVAVNSSTISPPAPYRITLPSNVNSTTVAITTTNAAATVAVGDLSGTNTVSGSLSLSTGSNSFTITVTAQDGTVATYSLIITNPGVGSSDNTLASVVVAGSTLTSPYSKTLASNAGSTAVTITSTNANATVAVGTLSGTNVATGSLTLSTGSNSFTITVTAQNGSVATYALTIVNPGTGAGGDPYVTALSGVVYKLPALDAPIRFYQGEVDGVMLTVNVTLRTTSNQALFDSNFTSYLRLKETIPAQYKARTAKSLMNPERLSFFETVRVQYGDSMVQVNLWNHQFQMEKRQGSLAAHAFDGTQLLGKYSHAYKGYRGQTIEFTFGSAKLYLTVYDNDLVRNGIYLEAPAMTTGNGVVVNALSPTDMTLKSLDSLAPVPKRDSNRSKTVRELFIDHDGTRVKNTITYK